jgi:hypothetical protein
MESIPGVWASVHHEGIVWCNQLLIRTISMMTDVAISVSSRSSLPERSTQTEGTDQGVTVQTEGRNIGKLLPFGAVSAQKPFVLKVARKALLGSGSLHQHLLLHPWSNPQHSNASTTAATVTPTASPEGAPGLGRQDGTLGGDVAHQALMLAEEKQCRGANLAWYLQYNTPRTVRKPMIKLKHSSIKVSSPSSYW